MNKIIFVTTTKPFNDLFGFRQVNAITSWSKLAGIDKHIYIFTEDDIIGHFDEETKKNITIVSKFERSGNSRIPTFRSLWDLGCEKAEEIGGFVCQINADIMLTKSFSDTVNSVIEQTSGKNFGIIGQRTDWKEPKPINFLDPEWEANLLESEKGNFELHAPCGMDFVLGTRETLPELPIFYIARLNYDRWIVRQVIERNEFSVDVSLTATAIHQDHGYGNDGSWDLENLIRNYNSEVSVNQHQNFYPVLNIDNSKHITTFDDNKIIIKSR